MNIIKTKTDDIFNPIVNNSLEQTNDKTAKYLLPRAHQCRNLQSYINRGVGFEFTIGYVTTGRGL